jgi:DNA-binding beta-propeller fold protein YncE
MSLRSMRLMSAGTAMFLACGAAAAAPQASDYHLMKKVVLGGEGGWDALAYDGSAGRLFISRSSHVLVVDANTYAVVGDIADTPGVHGIAVVPESGRGFTSNGRADSAAIFDLKTLKKLGEAKTGKNPDAIIYDPASKRVFVFNGKSQDATAIEAATGKVAGTVALGGKPEFAAADGSGQVFVNLEDKSEVAVLDSRKLKVKAHWPLKPCEEPSGMGLDIAHRRLFIGCSNKMMAVVDADQGRVIATPAIGEHVDGGGFDPATGLAFSSNGDGTLTAVHEDSPESFSVAANIPTQKGARTMALDPGTHRVFLVTAEFGPAPAATAEHPHPRPSIVPGTFTLLVVGTEAAP